LGSGCPPSFCRSLAMVFFSSTCWLGGTARSSRVHRCVVRLHQVNFGLRLQRTRSPGFVRDRRSGSLVNIRASAAEPLAAQRHHAPTRSGIPLQSSLVPCPPSPPAARRRRASFFYGRRRH
jgi:hypothetical protein